MKRLLCTLAVSTALHGCGGDAAPTPDAEAPEVGRLVIVGGALQSDNAAVYTAIAEGRNGDGPLCVIPTASGDPEEAMAGAVETLSGYAGEGPVKGILLSVSVPEDARDPVVAAELEACSGFYFTGGSQSRIVDLFLPGGDTTAAYRALRQRWTDGAVVAGSSAGAAMMSRVMVSGGNSTEALAVGVAATSDGDGVRLRPGMGFFEPIVDQHFLARGRIGRLLVALRHPDAPAIGLGIDENTALVVDGNSAVVVGASGVILVDGRGARSAGESRTTILTVSLVGAGDVIDLNTLETRRGSGKSVLAMSEVDAQLPADPFSRWSFLHVVHALSASDATAADFDVGEGRLRIVEDETFSAAASSLTGGVEGTPAGLSAGPFLVEVSTAGS